MKVLKIFNLLVSYFCNDPIDKQKKEIGLIIKQMEKANFTTFLEIFLKVFN